MNIPKELERRPNFMKTLLNGHYEKSKKQWQMMNRIINRARNQINVTKLTDEDGNSVTSSLDIAVQFNDYFNCLTMPICNIYSTWGSDAYQLL